MKLLDWGFAKGQRLEITTEQMLSLVDRSARRTQNETGATARDPEENVPGSVDAVLLEAFLAKAVELSLDKNDAIARGTRSAVAFEAVILTLLRTRTARTSVSGRSP